MALKRLAIVRAQRAARALLKTDQYSVRGVTQDAETPDAYCLKERGVELIRDDLDNPSTLAVVFTSAHVIFAVTTMYDGAMEREVAQGKK